MTRRTGCLNWARPDLWEAAEATPPPTRPWPPLGLPLGLPRGVVATTPFPSPAEGPGPTTFELPPGLGGSYGYPKI